MPDEYEYVKGSGPCDPDEPRPYKPALLWPLSNRGSPEALLKLQMAPKLIL